MSFYPGDRRNGTTSGRYVLFHIYFACIQLQWNNITCRVFAQKSTKTIECCWHHLTFLLANLQYTRTEECDLASAFMRLLPASASITHRQSSPCQIPERIMSLIFLMSCRCGGGGVLENSDPAKASSSFCEYLASSLCSCCHLFV